MAALMVAWMVYPTDVNSDEMVSKTAAWTAERMVDVKGPRWDYSEPLSDLHSVV
jgi:hypothetical protein